MLTSFQADNFRCFRHLQLSDLRMVNIIVGKNAAGKTALLEAIRLGLAGTPAALYGMNIARGLLNYAPQPTREQFEFLWNSYFTNLNAETPIETRCVDSEGHTASLKVYYDPSQAVTPMQPQAQAQAQGTLVSTIIPLVFERTDFSGKHSILRGTVLPQGFLNLENGPELGTVSEFYSATWQTNPQQTAQWFSQLSVQNREDQVIGPITREFESLIKNLTVLAPVPSAPAVYADVPFLKEKLPLSLISAGISKFVAILSAILTRRQGVVLIDEIENGIYYQSFPYLWKNLVELAKVHETQVFVSTHSLECLRGLLPSLENNEQEVLLLRAARENGSSAITPVEGRLIEAALEQGFDVR